MSIVAICIRARLVARFLKFGKIITQLTAAEKINLQHFSDAYCCREALRRHYRTHSSEQPYGCRQCPKRFRSSYARTIHELTHAGVVFRCTYCDKSYRYKSQLMLHLRKSHPESQTATERASSEEVEQNPEIEMPIKDEFPTRKNVPSKKKKSM